MRPIKYRIVILNMSRLPLSRLRMRKQTLLLLATLAAIPAFAQSDDDKPAAQPVENLYFSTDEYVAIPKYTFSYGYRALSGSKASFGGSAIVQSLSNNIGDLGLTTETRVYNDGSVGLDTRKDGNGRDLPSDGTTNNWAYRFSSQEALDGYIQFHSYSATVIDDAPYRENMGNSYGLEVVVSRDLPKLGRRVLWNITGGVSLNDIRQGLTTNVGARVTTTTDSFYLNGAAAPGASYATPSSETVSLVGSDGGSTDYTSTVATTTNISAQPDDRLTVVQDNVEGVLSNRYKIKGSYYTFRLGTTFIFPVTAKFRVSVGLGGLLIYAGTNYSVDSEFQATEELTTITKSDTSYDTAVRPGYYLDANLEYWISERSGLFAGAIFQSSGSYTQRVVNEEVGSEADYSSRVDLSAQSGMRLGMNVRF